LRCSKIILELLRIIEEYILKEYILNRTMEITLEKMSTAPAPVVHNSTNDHAKEHDSRPKVVLWWLDGV